jgi:two-component system nitrate/nitrite response regulator NarL
MVRKRESGQAAVLRLVIADDHRLLLGAVQARIEPEADLEVAGVAYEASRILALVAELEPDLLLLDSGMPGMDVLAFLDCLRVAHPTVTVVLMTESRDPALASAALEHGASGVISKGADPDALAPALRAAIHGESPHPEPYTPPRAPDALGLTPREEAVLQALGRGLSNAEIAQDLSIANGTVKFHLRHAYEKLGVATRLDALRVMVERGIFGNPYDWL